VTARRDAIAYAAVAAILFAGFFALGVYVAHHGEPPALWAFAQNVRGHSLGLAWALTNAGWPQVLGPLYASCLILAMVNSRWRVRSLYVVVCALVAWRAADAFQHYFARPRRGDWLIRHEHAFSYPSSHAAISTAFYFLWGIVLLRSNLPRGVRYAGFVVLTAFAGGIVWSRLSLAAHYPTDVGGGIMLGLVVSLLGAAAVKVLASPGAAA
jgi:undecaprenyl-diphosphatase